MGFNREQAWFKASCLSHDVVDIFNMMTDCALEPRNFNSTSVAMAKLPNSYNYQKSANGWSDFSNLVFKAVYGSKGLGNNLYGNPDNYKNLDAYTM